MSLGARVHVCVCVSVCLYESVHACACQKTGRDVTAAVLSAHAENDQQQTILSGRIGFTNKVKEIHDS